ncbi:flagellar biosynthesis protein FlhB [Salinicola acroporae]|uniref:Flagellar biosynthetic protein FlhB n=1 Tax=Salinicola acroporae TaxID=1541440 RepID=A0ABT6I6M2_9GAMM|nr:flagellar biosynthesis protein FlhB [Salinicola acroporae]MDH4573316.1 flagellar biosynthetic protein FlhB [Salinicola acroporae]
MAEQNDSDQEKTEPATPRRIEKAREEGQVARSRELATFLLLVSGVLGLWIMGNNLYDELGIVMEQAFLFDHGLAFDTARMLSHVWSMGEHTLIALLPLFLLFTVAAILGPTMLGGWLLSAKSLKPQLSKLNPLKGLKRMFSTQALAELAKAIAKSVLVGGVGVAYLWTQRDTLLALMEMPIQQALATAMRMAAVGCALIVTSLLLVILIDVPYQIWSHNKKLRMSREDIRQEHKETEGDPHVKGRIRSQQQAMARRRMMSKVPTADVIVTNPTHYAVALSYQQDAMSAPIVIAKGADQVAARIRELGDENRVPRLEAPPLARALYHHVDLDQEIPGDLYTAVAEVLAWAFRLKQVESDGGEVPAAPRDLPVPTALDDAAPDSSKESE